MTNQNPFTLLRHQLVAEHETLAFLATSQYEKIFGRQLRFVHAFNGGFYYVDLNGHEITDENIKTLETSMKKIIEGDTPIEFVKIARKELLKKFEGNHDDKVAVLKFWPSQTVDCIMCDGCIDYVYQPHSTDKTRLKIFSVMKYDKGFMIRFPTLVSPDAIPEWKEQAVLKQVIDQYEETKKICNVQTISDLNKLIYGKKETDIKNICEGIHEKHIKEIADSLCKNFEKKRIITIAGASSSNKTTFALKLAMQLRINGYDALVIGMDDYFLDEADIPYDENGEQDWEAVTTLNLPLMGERIGRLMNGETVPRRRFDWALGKSVDDAKETQTLSPHGFLIMEGIHGLNPALLEILGADRVTPIYLQCTSPINIDNTHRFPASDLRLLRRLIRDYKFRAYPPRPMFQRWTSVRIGEMNNIFPFQSNAEYVFNSTSVYEVSVLAAFGKTLCCESSILMDDEKESEESDAVTNETYLMMNKLQFFGAISLHIVPNTSCIREFMGGSDLKY